jgi:hypothetical protein
MNYECKTIPGYEDYQIDTNGNVWSFKSGVKTAKKPSLQVKGYLFVGLYNNGNRKNFLVHRLIMLTFCGESDLQVNHIDGIKTNNNLTNLEYCTPLENMRHAVELGLTNRNKGEGNKSSKLTEENVICIKKELLFNYHGLIIKLAKRYNVSTTVIQQIKKGNTWKHVKLN